MQPLTARQRDTILAALRFYQANLQRNGKVSGNATLAAAIRQIASDHGEPLDRYQIDVLCERVNR